MTNLEIPNTLSRYVEEVQIVYAQRYVNKFTGFETKKHRFRSSSGSDQEADVSIMLVGDLPRWLCGLLCELAKGCNGAGMRLELYDDWISDKQYTGLWANAGDFVDNSELLCGASMYLKAFDIQDI